MNLNVKMSNDVQTHFIRNGTTLQTQSKIILHFYITVLLCIIALCQNKQFFYAYFAAITSSSN